MKNEELGKSKETISMLENKFSKAEAETLRIFEEKKTEVDILKKEIKALNCEIKKQNKQ